MEDGASQELEGKKETKKSTTIHFISKKPRTFDSLNIKHNQISAKEILDYCLSKKILAVDTETEGLDFLTKRVIMFQIGDAENQFVIDTRDYDISFLRPVLESRTIKKLLHNVKFDYKFIKKCYNITLENIYDTMISERILSTGKDILPGYHSLEQVCLRRLGKQLDKSTRNQFINLGGQPFTDKQIVYGAEDVENLIKIAKSQIEEVNKYGLGPVLELENEVSLAFSDIEYNGIGLDVEKWKLIADDSKIELDNALKDLNEEIFKDSLFTRYINKNVQIDMFAETAEYEVLMNWSSPLQVLTLFKLIVPTLENVNAKELYTIKNRHVIIKKYIRYKEVEKKSNAYGMAFLKYLGADNRIHTSFNQILNTGRVSSRDPNMQQIPADNKYRNCFISGYDDWVFVSSDYSSQELCIIAYGSKDPVWLKALSEGKDLHSVCAELVYGKIWEDAQDPDCDFYKIDPVTNEMQRSKCNCKEHKSLRNGVKTINFGLAYGMSKFKLADTLLIEIEEAAMLIEKYFSSFPSIKKFLDSLGTYGLDNGFIKTFAPYKRIRWFSKWKPNIRKDRDLFKEVGSIERASKNTPIQGSGADMCKYALTLVRDYIAEHNVPVKIVMAVHDQIDTIVHKDYAEQWKEEFTALMKKSTLPIIPNGLLEADTNISDFWEK